MQLVPTLGTGDAAVSMARDPRPHGADIVQGQQRATEWSNERHPSRCRRMAAGGGQEGGSRVTRSLADGVKLEGGTGRGPACCRQREQ